MSTCANEEYLAKEIEKILRKCPKNGEITSEIMEEMNEFLYKYRQGEKPAVEEDPYEEEVPEKPKVHPHNIQLNRKGVYAFKGQDPSDVIKILQKANKQERERACHFMGDNSSNEPRLSFEGIRTPCEEVKLEREPAERPRIQTRKSKVARDWEEDERPKPRPSKVPDWEEDENDDEDWDEEEAACDENMFVMNKLAGIQKTESDVSDFRRLASVKDYVVETLRKKYRRMDFDWSSDPDSYADQYLLINSAKTKISINPLVEIYEAVSQISDENDAMSTTCQVVISKISSLFE